MNRAISLIILLIFFCMVITACSVEPPAYDSKQAIANGDVVSVHGQVTNLSKLDDFIDNVRNNKKDEVTVTSYTIEGDAIIRILDYDGKTIKYSLDARRDRYAGNGNRSIEKYEFMNIDKETKDNITIYFLYNDDETSRTDILIAVTAPNE